MAFDSSSTSYTIPVDFINLNQDRRFLEATFLSSLCTIVGEKGLLGIRYTVWRFCIEYYTTEEEPALLPYQGIRLIFWHRMTKDTIPHRWYKLPFKNTKAHYVVVLISDKDTYMKQWSKTFRNYSSLFDRQHDYAIKEISCVDYAALYHVYTTDTKRATHSLSFTEKYYTYFPSSTYFYVLYHTVTGEVVGGIASLDCDRVSQSYYISAFTDKKRAPPACGLWLCDHQMKQSSKRGIRYANLGVIWSRGQPRSWKGFSNFKMKFNPIPIMFKKDLVRMTFFG